MIFNKKLLREFWQLKKKISTGLKNEIEGYEKGKGWFKRNEDELFKFLARRSVKLETRISKTELEKMVRRHIPFASVKRWEGNELIVDIDIVKLKREVIRESQIFAFRQEIKLSPTDYILCPIVKEEHQKYFLLIQ